MIPDTRVPAPGGSTYRRAFYHASLLAVTLAVVLLGCRENVPRPEQAVNVFAAASLAEALEALADSFAAAHPGYRIRANFAATSILARQIEQGAPADVFFSASAAWMRRVDSLDLVGEPVRYPLGNRLVVAGPPGSTAFQTIEEITRVKRLALADPESVPAGIYAREGLRCLGLWEPVSPLVVPTQDVRAALQAVRSGAADAAVVYGSDLRAEPGVTRLADWPAECHPDVRYALAPVKAGHNPAGGRLFISFITDPRRDSLWSAYGFLPRRE